MFCIWPRTGEPIIVTHHAGRPVTERDSWIERIEVIEDYVQSGIQGAAKVLRSLGLDGEKIGFEKTYVSASRWTEIEQELPRAALFDCTELMGARSAAYETRAATSSAMASDDVRPGDSIPNRFTMPSMPWVSGPWMTKSGAVSPGP